MNKIILPSFLKPIKETDLIKIGNKEDGGYVIPKNSIDHTDILYSFGLDSNWTFEKEFYYKKKCQIFVYDHSVNWKTFFISSIKSPKTILRYFKYRNFFDNKSKYHIKEMIHPLNSFILSSTNNTNNPYRLADLDSIIINPENKSLFFKIDIEGSEYRILNQLIKYSKKINGLVIEFHDCDLNFDKIKKFLINFELDLVHLHVNNWSFLSNEGFPGSIELTFSHKDFNRERLNQDKSYPTSLDMPNNPLYEDLPIEFRDY
jgi:hypothetical protein